MKPFSTSPFRNGRPFFPFDNVQTADRSNQGKKPLHLTPSHFRTATQTRGHTLAGRTARRTRLSTSNQQVPAVISKSSLELLTASTRVDWFFLARSKLWNLIRGVFQTKASSPWAGNKSKRIQAFLYLPTNERDLDAWYEAVSLI